jgi:hypothetical protein
MNPVVNDALTWGALIMAGSSIVALIKFWMEIGKALECARIGEEERAILGTKLEITSSSLADFKIEAAKTYATNRQLADAETALAAGLRDAVQGVYSRLDAVTTRLDSLVTMARENR